MDGLRPRGRQLPSSTEPLSDGSQGLLLRRARRRPASSRRENHRQGRRRWGVRTRIPDLPTQIGPPRSSTRCRSPRWRPKGGGPTHRGPGMGCRCGHLPVGRTQHRPQSSSVHWREQKGYAESVTGHTRLAVVNQCRCVSRRQQRPIPQPQVSCSRRPVRQTGPQQFRLPSPLPHLQTSTTPPALVRRTAVSPRLSQT